MKYLSLTIRTTFHLAYTIFLHTGCSGNGVCVTDSSCHSRCRCGRRWEGGCCERRRPIRTWGDPHLQTLDGQCNVCYDFDVKLGFY